MSTTYRKIQSVAKKLETKGDRLSSLILGTMSTISNIVGSTLGPNGAAVLIERYEADLPPILTKDGVSVFKSLGFENSTAHCIMEAARDAAVNTAKQAGDGTTTATILSEAIVSNMMRYCKNNPKVSPQKAVRRLEEVFSTIIEPFINKSSIKVDSSSKEGLDLLKSVATISANGDVRLAETVLECIDLVGDEGNVTIVEMNGKSRYEVEKINGYSVGLGYEDCAGGYSTKFINDIGTQRCVMEKPVFLCYYGKVTEIQTIQLLMEKVGEAWGSGQYEHHNVVLVATGFSESVIGQLALNFSEPRTINVFPLMAPLTAMPNCQLHFLEDVCAITGATLLDPMNNPIEQSEIDDLGPGIELFESNRTSCNIIGHADEEFLLERVDELKAQIEVATSELDKNLLQERVGKIIGGIARLKVFGSSNGETKEKRDRAEDAICAVKGAIKHGCLPGGGWVFLKLNHILKTLLDPIVNEVLTPALETPLNRLLTNCGLNSDDIQQVVNPILESIKNNEILVYDALNHVHVAPVKGGILDSTPAVLEAIRNSISIASILGTLGGSVCFIRDNELERSEAIETAQYMRDVNSNH